MNTVLTLFHGGGASGWAPGDLAFPTTKERQLFEACAKLINATTPAAAALLRTKGFELRHGINDFADEFFVLTKEVGLDEYLQYQDNSHFSRGDDVFRVIVQGFKKLGIYVRFIGVELILEDEVTPVSAPQMPSQTSASVIAALGDAETLISGGNFIGAIDRIHTALHGYVRHLCEIENLTGATGDIELPRALKLLRENHPKLNTEAPHHEHIGKILKAMGSICDTLGTIRNHGSLAHANPSLVQEADALLTVNAARTILRYLVDKIEKTGL